MLKPENFDNVQGYGQNQPLPAGGYVCKVRNIDNHITAEGKKMWKVMLDIAEGEYKDYFYKKYQNNKQYRPDAKYPNSGIAYVSLYDNTGKPHRALKTFYLALKDSGTEIVWSEDDTVTFRSIQGAIIGSLFGREEYIGNDNNVHWSTKHKLFISADDVRNGNFSIPEDKLLEQSGYAGGFENSDMPSGFNAVTDEIPF